MSKLIRDITAVTQLPFVADAYPYKDAQTIVVVLKPEIRVNLPLNRSMLTFQADNFTVDAVIQAYQQEVVLFLAKTLHNAELLLAKSTKSKLTHLVPLCLN
ncbi:hypothetical protein [Spirosoma radiotolerans]|uniref:Uncharacterized protein n=1 Tax=Spirosoma radiotolerans TaxID=1379870 RepID=A0A0E3ZUR8_9BACT|nr:hypothetical protein [Spirosoma radiotolerans]AKD54688.1 hypothetical protein SD10_06965 [Spirosoma radiotolerans]